MGARPHALARRRGFTLVEIALVVGIIGILAAMAVAGFKNYRERAYKASAIATMKSISTIIDAFRAFHDRYPKDLAEAGVASLRDPWHNPYQYNDFATTSRGRWRKDRFLVPINSSYDLWSMGPDGRSVAALTARTSRDDVIRANDGTFYGFAADY